MTAPAAAVPAIFCRCASGDCIHKSDCEVHGDANCEEGSCTCLTPAEKRALPDNHYSDGRRYSHISKAWIFAEHWNDREEAARLSTYCATLQLERDELLVTLEREQTARQQEFVAGHRERGDLKQHCEALEAALGELLRMEAVRDDGDPVLEAARHNARLALSRSSSAEVTP